MCIRDRYIGEEIHARIGHSGREKIVHLKDLSNTGFAFIYKEELKDADGAFVYKMCIRDRP